MNRNVSTTILLASALFFSISPSFAFEPPAPSIQKIIIDPGYGGDDEGPTCKNSGIKTKDINLSISKKLAQVITDKLDIKAILTRNNDKFVLLDERTAIANIENGDLFISIHTNSSDSSEAYGIETYTMNSRASDKYAAEISARENPSSSEFETVLKNVLVDMQVKNKTDESESLAKIVQQSIFDYLNPKYSHIKNRGVKRGPFYVLIGANMPSIVVATGFVSNSRECERLASDKYQRDIAKAISFGIERYIKKFNKDR